MPDTATFDDSSKSATVPISKTEPRASGSATSAASTTAGSGRSSASPRWAGPIRSANRSSAPRSLFRTARTSSSSCATISPVRALARRATWGLAAKAGDAGSCAASDSDSAARIGSRKERRTSQRVTTTTHLARAAWSGFS